jgi:glycosyltransferase involved in cell wall biosynthesis
VRLAWFTPWPPQASGIAGRSADLVAALCDRGAAIDVFADERQVDVRRASSDPPAAGQYRLQSAHEFIWRQRRGQYDLAIYQIGNSRLHDFIWPYLFRWPGLTVLHDARVHHARGHALLSRHLAADYRAEFAWAEPTIDPNAAELAVHGYDGPYYYLWPMRRGVLDASKVVATHSRGVAAELGAAGEPPVLYVALGEGVSAPPSAEQREALRQSLHFGPDDVVFGVFGSLTPEKRVWPILRAFAGVRARAPQARLLLAGAPDPALDVDALIEALSLRTSVSVLSRPDDRTFDQWMTAVDVSLNLRWPTSLETSGPWLRALSAGRPTVILDLAHQAHLPALDPQNWQARSGHRPVEPITIAIDILDEEHSLRLAMHRLTIDEGLRERLGRAARRYWEQEHTLARMVDDYLGAIECGIRAAEPARPLPSALRPDALEHTRALLGRFGGDVCGLR